MTKIACSIENYRPCMLTELNEEFSDLNVLQLSHLNAAQPLPKLLQQMKLMLVLVT